MVPVDLYRDAAGRSLRLCLGDLATRRWRGERWVRVRRVEVAA